jgi:hypothetical protein
MKNYDFPQKFKALYDQAVSRYAQGQRNADELFNSAESAWLNANGLTPQHLFDYAEDHNNYGEPGFEHALTIEAIRRDYFRNVQGGQPLVSLLNADKLPAKSDAIRGIEWLPRIIPKTKAKLQGALPPALMYCCGGDRIFFKTHDIQPAEFLALVWRHENNDAAIVDWVVKRTSAK